MILCPETYCEEFIILLKDTVVINLSYLLLLFFTFLWRMHIVVKLSYWEVTVSLSSISLEIKKMEVTWRWWNWGGIVNSLGLPYKQVQKGGGGRRFCSVEAY